jgi:two-component system, response regulator RegA
MAADIPKRKRLLFVDDDAACLGVLEKWFSRLSKGAWEIFTAENHAQALAELQRQRMDVIVLDWGMPVMDGSQLLRLLGRTHPGQQVVILTGDVTEEKRKTCLDNGAVLVLQKPISQEDYAMVYSALDSLAEARCGEGFQGVMQRVGLHEVLQFECLGRRSSILEVFTGNVRGKIFICEGAIVHADSGVLQGEAALYTLLALRGGGFNLLPFAEPPRRSIESSWEMLLMESARLSDESAESGASEIPAATQTEPKATLETQAPEAVEAGALEIPPGPLVETGQTRIVEVVLCSGSGEVLYDWGCESLERRLALLEQVEQQGSRLGGLGPVGRFDRMEMLTADGRTVCQVQPHRRLFVRSVGGVDAV